MLRRRNHEDSYVPAEINGSRRAPGCRAHGSATSLLLIDHRVIPPSTALASLTVSWGRRYHPSCRTRGRWAVWIVKGALLGILLFILAGISYMWIRIKIGLHLFANGHTHGTLPHYESTQLLHNPVFWPLSAVSNRSKAFWALPAAAARQ